MSRFQYALLASLLAACEAGASPELDASTATDASIDGALSCSEAPPGPLCPSTICYLNPSTPECGHICSVGQCFTCIAGDWQKTFVDCRLGYGGDGGSAARDF